MLLAIAAVLLLMWLAALTGSLPLGPAMHVLFWLALIAILAALARRRTPVGGE